MKKLPDLIAIEMKKGDNALKAASKLFENGLYDDCVSRCYYAVLHYAKSALYKNGIKVDSHKGLISMFGKHLIKTGIIEKEYSVILAHEKDEREFGDYGAIDIIEKDRAEKALSDARKFIDRLKKYLTV